MKKNIALFVSVFLWLMNGNAQQGKLVDEIVGVVGENIILESDIAIEFGQMRKEFNGINDSARCDILRQQLVSKLLLTQAQLDSIELPEERVESELDRRIRFFASQNPDGEKGLEAYYGKTIAEIKSSNKEKVKQNILIQEMQGKILREVKVSPSDIKSYYNSLAKIDSLPYYSSELEIAQIVIQPKVSKEAKEIARQKIVEIRERVTKGESFNTLALIYSDDKASASRSGELGYFARGEMVPEFEAAAFKLKPDSISKIIETKYGYHILKLIDRKGDNINVRHILIRPQIFRSDVDKAKEKTDSIVWQIKIDSLKFEDAAKKFSDDISTKNNGGFIAEGQIGTTKIPVDELPKDLYFLVEKMKPGDITDPELITLPGPDKEKAYRVLYLRSESKPHVCNLKDDYQKLQAMAMQKKQQKTMERWVEKHKKNIFISVSDTYKNCPNIVQFLKK